MTAREQYASIKVLIAEDHELVRQGLSYTLKEEGFQIVGEAENGEEAIELIQQQIPHRLNGY